MQAGLDQITSTVWYAALLVICFSFVMTYFHVVGKRKEKAQKAAEKERLREMQRNNRRY